MQALSDRLADHDFLAYAASSTRGRVNTAHASHSARTKYDASYPFSIEKRDGSVSKLSIQLANSTPHQILGRMADSINFAPPPPPPEPVLDHSMPFKRQGMYDETAKQNVNMQDDVGQFIWSYGIHNQHHKSPNSTDRNLVQFLKKVDFDHIKQRKFDRINATAAALVARRAFQFSAVDGTGLGWSSASLAILLSRLTSLHEEHESKLIKSFYPFRLVFSGDEFHRKIDLYGGIIRLNPAATSLQWLETLIRVNTDSIMILKHNQKELKQKISTLEKVLGIRAVKGHTCDPEDYHRALSQLTQDMQGLDNICGDGKSLLAVSNKANLVIESRDECRRGKVRKDGSFEVGVGMDISKIRKLLSDYANRSYEYIQLESDKQQRYQELSQNVAYDIGIEKVKRFSSIVTSEQMIGCLTMMLNKEESEKEALRGYLAGQSIGVAARGTLCHLGDDGSIVIPTNCS